MAFNSSNFTLDRGAFNAVTGFNSPAIHRYRTTTDTIAQVEVAGYFNSLILDPATQLTNQSPTLEMNDLIYTVMSNGHGMAVVTAITPNVTISYTGFTPFIAQFAGTFAFGGGSASATIPVVGLVTTDIPMAAIRGSTNPVFVEKVTPITNGIIVTMSADPGVSTLNYVAFR